MKKKRKKSQEKSVQDITILRMEFGMRITLERRLATEKKLGAWINAWKKCTHRHYVNTIQQATTASIPIYKNAIRRHERGGEGEENGAGENLKTILDGQDDEQRTTGATHDIAKSIRLYF